MTVNNPTQEELRLKGVYRDWVHANDGTHQHRNNVDDGVWQGCWRDLVVMTFFHYYAPVGKVGRCFVRALNQELRGVQDIQWNSEQSIVF